MYRTTNKPISLEAAKLLGTVFAWRDTIPMRFVPTPDGPVLQWYRFTVWDRKSHWTTADLVIRRAIGELFAERTAYVCEWGGEGEPK